MQAFRKPSPLARSAQKTSEVRGAEQSPEQSASALSGTYFRAVRPPSAEAGALASGQSVLDCAKIEGLRFELDVGVWRGESEQIARCVIEDAECTCDAGNQDE